jgi:hypothetical protein
VATGTSRRASCFREVTAGARERVAREAIVDARGGGGGLGWVCSRPEPGARRGGLQWRRRSGSTGDGGYARARFAVPLL